MHKNDETSRVVYIDDGIAIDGFGELRIRAKAMADELFIMNIEKDTGKTDSELHFMTHCLRADREYELYTSKGRPDKLKGNLAKHSMRLRRLVWHTERLITKTEARLNKFLSWDKL